MRVSSGAIVAATIASMCFGASVVATRFVVSQTDPVSLAVLRYAIASICLSPVLLRVVQRRMPWRDATGIAVLGALFFGLFPWSFSAALIDLPSSRVAVLLATMPLVTLIVSRIRGIERLTWPMVGGQCMAFLGIALSLLPAQQAPDRAINLWRGVGLTAVTVLCGAIYNVFSRRYLKRYAPLQVTALSMAAGVLTLAPLALSRGLFAHVPSFTPGGWMALGFLGTFGGALGFALWIWALERSTPSRVAVFIGLNPVTATVLGGVLLHESISALFLVGLCLVIGGIMLANWQPAPRETLEPAA